MAEAYEQLLPMIAAHVAEPWPLQQVSDQERYSVVVNGREVIVRSQDTAETDGREGATAVCFGSINGQLAAEPAPLYALNAERT